MNETVKSTLESLKEVRDSMSSSTFKKDVEALISFYKLYGDLGVLRDSFSELNSLQDPNRSNAKKSTDLIIALQNLKTLVKGYFSSFNQKTYEEKKEFFQGLKKLSIEANSLENVGLIDEILSILEKNKIEHSGDESINKIVSSGLEIIIKKAFTDATPQSEMEILKKISEQASEISQLKAKFEVERTRILESSRRAREIPELFFVNTKFSDSYLNWFWQNTYPDTEVVKVQEDVEKLSGPGMDSAKVRTLGLGLRINALGLSLQEHKDSKLWISKKIDGLNKDAIDLGNRLLGNDKIDADLAERYFSYLDSKSLSKIKVLLGAKSLGIQIPIKDFREILEKIDKEGGFTPEVKKLITQTFEKQSGFSQQQISQALEKIFGNSNDFLVEGFTEIFKENIQNIFDDLQQQLKEDKDSILIGGKEIVIGTKEERNKAIVTTLLMLKRFAEDPQGTPLWAKNLFVGFIKYAFIEPPVIQLLPDNIQKLHKENMFAYWIFPTLLFIVNGIRYVEYKRAKARRDIGNTGNAEKGEANDRREKYDARKNQIKLFRDFFVQIGDEKGVEILDDLKENSPVMYGSERQFKATLLQELQRSRGFSSLSHRASIVLGKIIQTVRPFHYLRMKSGRAGLSEWYGSASQILDNFEMAIENFNNERAYLENLVKNHPLLNKGEKGILEKVDTAIKKEYQRKWAERVSTYIKRLNAPGESRIDASSSLHDVFREAGLPTLDSDLIDFISKGSEKVTQAILDDEIKKAQDVITRAFSEDSKQGEKSARQIRVDVLADLKEKVQRGLSNSPDGWFGTVTELKARIFFIVDSTRDPSKFLDNPESWNQAKTGKELIDSIESDVKKLRTLESGSFFFDTKAQGKKSEVFKELEKLKKYFDLTDNRSALDEVGKIMNGVLKGDSNSLTGLDFRDFESLKHSLGERLAIDINTLPSLQEIERELVEKSLSDTLIKEYAQLGEKSSLYETLKRYELFLDLQGDELSRRKISALFDRIIDGESDQIIKEGIKFNDIQIFEEGLKRHIKFVGDIPSLQEITKRIIKIGDQYFFNLGIGELERIQIIKEEQRMSSDGKLETLSREFSEKGLIRKIVTEIPEVLKHSLRK